MKTGRKLIDDFFRKNKAYESEMPSAAALMNFKIKMMMDVESNEVFEDLTRGVILESQKNRRENVIAEQSAIQAATSHEEIVKFMRRGIDNINDGVLLEKALSFEKELVPDVVKRLRTNMDYDFIELATTILSSCHMDVSNDLIAYFDDVRIPYVQSMILVVLGFKAGEEHIPWIIEKYHQLRKLYPEESYSDGAIYALAEIEERLYT